MRTIKQTAITFLLLSLSTFVFADRDVTILAGKITNPNSDTILIVDNYRQPIKTVQLEPDHSFRTTLEHVDGYYHFTDGVESAQIYLKPGYDLHFTLNTEQFDETLTFSGRGAPINNYLIKKYLLEEGIGNLSSMSYFVKLDEKPFLNLQDSLLKLNLNLLESMKLDKDFAFIQKKTLQFHTMLNLSEFESLKQYFTRNDSFRVSENYPDPFKNFDINDEVLFKVPNYGHIGAAYLNYRLKNSPYLGKDRDHYCTFLNTLIDVVKLPRGRQAIAYPLFSQMLLYTSNLDSTYSLLLKTIHDEDKTRQVTARYKKLKSLSPGAPSPSFTFKDSSGNEVSLEDLKGKVVYIDIWATWCGPCIMEIPHLLKLEEKYKDKNITFVSICMNDAKNRWTNYLRKNEMSGIQLYAEMEDKKFFEDYAVNGIPHFILLDQQGNIVDAHADRPSMESLPKKINEVLKTKD